jgi:hypothetical protein
MRLVILIRDIGSEDKKTVKKREDLSSINKRRVK